MTLSRAVALSAALIRAALIRARLVLAHLVLAPLVLAPLVLAPLILAMGPGLAAAQTFPPLTGRVVDGAGILSPASEAQLTQKLAGLEARTGIQLVVVTLDSLGGYAIEDYGYRLGRAWGIGQAEEDDGALFITAPAERKVRVEVGYGLGGRLTALMSGVILRERVLPLFRENRMEAGVVAGTDALIQHLSLPAGQARARVAQAEAQQASGSGTDGGAGGIVIALLLLWFVVAVLSSRGRRGRRHRRRGGGLAGDVAQVVLWSMLNSRGGGGGGRGGGWGGGGGGFRGGGGSFGGGGASGSW